MEKKDFEKYIEENYNVITDISKNAKSLHNEVNQKYDDKPYSVHLSSVAHYAKVYGYNVCENDNDILPLIFGAYFHDSIEDARLTYNDVTVIARKYMTNQQAYVATEIVYALTNEKGRNRTERANEKYYSGIRETPFAPFVKMCDRFANMSYSSINKSRMIDVYKKEFEHFLDCITVKDNSDCRFSIPNEMINEIKNLWLKSWKIFGVSLRTQKNEFYKDKNETIKLLEIVKYIRSLTSTAYEKNQEILDYLDSNIYNYPNYMFDYISNLISRFKYGCKSNDYNFIYVIFNVTQIN